VYRFHFARCMNMFNSLLAQLVKYDVHTARKIKVDTRYFLSNIIILSKKSILINKYSVCYFNFIC